MKTYYTRHHVRTIKDEWVTVCFARDIQKTEHGFQYTNTVPVHKTATGSAFEACIPPGEALGVYMQVHVTDGGITSTDGSVQNVDGELHVEKETWVYCRRELNADGTVTLYWNPHTRCECLRDQEAQLEAA